MRNLNDIVLKNYGGYNAKVELDESIDDIVFAMKYDDHGDEFLVVKTLDGKVYEYGLYITRNGYDDNPNSERNKRLFVKVPKMKYSPTDYVNVSNEVFWLQYTWLYNEQNDNGPGSFHRKSRFDHYGYYSSEDKYAVLSKYLDHVEFYTGKDGDKFNLNIINTIKDDVAQYFYREKLDLSKIGEYNQRIDGFLQNEPSITAGKMEVSNHISGDYIQWMIYKGQPVKVKKKELNMKTYRDRWGSRTFACSIERYS